MTPMMELAALLLLIVLAWRLNPAVRRYRRRDKWRPSPGFGSPPTVRRNGR